MPSITLLIYVGGVRIPGATSKRIDDIVDAGVCVGAVPALRGDGRQGLDYCLISENR